MTLRERYFFRHPFLNINHKRPIKKYSSFLRMYLVYVFKAYICIDIEIVLHSLAINMSTPVKC